MNHWTFNIPGLENDAKPSCKTADTDIAEPAWP